MSVTKPIYSTIRATFQEWNLPLPEGGLWALREPIPFPTPEQVKEGYRAEDVTLAELGVRNLYLVSGKHTKYLALAQDLAEWSYNIARMGRYAETTPAPGISERHFASSVCRQHAEFLPEDVYRRLFRDLEARTLKAFEACWESVLASAADTTPRQQNPLASLEALIEDYSEFSPGACYAPAGMFIYRKNSDALEMAPLCLRALFPTVIEYGANPSSKYFGVIKFPWPSVPHLARNVLHGEFGVTLGGQAIVQPEDDEEFFETLKVLALEMPFEDAVRAARAIR